MAQAWPAAPYAFDVGVIEEPDPNALALPGGRILVTRGLLLNARSENELAFVLGHELGHFRNRDHLRSLGRGLVTGLLTSALGAATGLGGSNPLGLAQGFAERGFGRSQERDADAFALGLVYALYGHVAGADDFFERLTADSSRRGVGRLGRWLSTHPLSQDRIASLQRLAQERGWRAEGKLTPWSALPRRP